MKKLIHKSVLVLGSFFLFHSSFAQNVYIPDSVFRAFLQQQYPTCMVGDSLNTTCSDVLQDTSLEIHFSGLHDLTGIEYWFDQFPATTTLFPPTL